MTLARRASNGIPTLWYQKLNVTSWAFLFALATALSWLIPPMQSPDETSHLARAYLLAKGSWLLQPAGAQASSAPQDAKLLAFLKRMGGQSDAGGLVDPALLRFMDTHLNLALDAKLRLSPADQEQLARLRWTTPGIHFSIPRTGYYFPLVYAPQAVGLALGMNLNLNVEASYRLARTVTLLICFALLAAAFRVASPSPLALATLLLPMSVFQLLSPTLDGLTTSLSLFTLSLFTRTTTGFRQNSWRPMLGLAACVFVLASSRTHLLPLLALPFYTAWRHKSARDFGVASAIAITTLAWVLYALHTTSDTFIARSQTSSELLLHYARNPGEFFRIVWTTLSDPALFTFYQRSFIGILGWLDTALPPVAYPILWTGLAVSALISVSPLGDKYAWGGRVLLIGSAIVSVGLIFVSQLVTWTPHPATVIQGVQGRYLVIPVMMLGYAVSGFSPGHGKRQGLMIAVTLAVFALISLTTLTITLFNRYVTAPFV